MRVGAGGLSDGGESRERREGEVEAAAAAAAWRVSGRETAGSRRADKRQREVKPPRIDPRDRSCAVVEKTGPKIW
jgi:hypothetical protein